jgi:hypothetical protein
MSTPDSKSANLAYAAFAILREYVADRCTYSHEGFRRFQADFREACANAGTDHKTVLIEASRALCERQPGFEERLRRRVSQVVAGFAYH